MTLDPDLDASLLSTEDLGSSPSKGRRGSVGGAGSGSGGVDLSRPLGSLGSFSSASGGSGQGDNPLSLSLSGNTSPTPLLVASPLSLLTHDLGAGLSSAADSPLDFVVRGVGQRAGPWAEYRRSGGQPGLDLVRPVPRVCSCVCACGLSVPHPWTPPPVMCLVLPPSFGPRTCTCSSKPTTFLYSPAARPPTGVPVRRGCAPDLPQPIFSAAGPRVWVP